MGSPRKDEENPLKAHVVDSMQRSCNTTSNCFVKKAHVVEKRTSYFVGVKAAANIATDQCSVTHTSPKVASQPASR